jgi:UDP-GlcNAc:undecaprenyl-phosphate GlcNAc-1-phosphate transferase
MDASNPWLLFGLAAVLSWAAVRAGRFLAHRFGILDRPGAHKGHAAPVPLLGGVGVIVGAVLSLVVLQIVLEPRPTQAFGVAPEMADSGFGALLPWFAAGLAVALGTGLVDDLAPSGLTPTRKIFGQAVAAAVFSVGFALEGAQGEALSITAKATAAGAAILLVTNAFNLLDNMNGLSAGAGGILLVAIAWIASPADPWLAATAIALAGGLAGFLPQNYPRARVFLGDGGSHAVGYSVAALAVVASGTRVAGCVPWALPLVLFALPLLDVVWVIVRRSAERRPIFVGDRGHLSHRLVAAGLSPPVAVALLWGYAGWTGGLALLLASADPLRIVAVVAAAWLPGGYLFLLLLRRVSRSR